jgi:hypothetical protein
MLDLGNDGLIGRYECFPNSRIAGTAYRDIPATFFFLRPDRVRDEQAAVYLTCPVPPQSGHVSIFSPPHQQQVFGSLCLRSGRLSGSLGMAFLISLGSPFTEAGATHARARRTPVAL